MTRIFRLAAMVIIERPASKTSITDLTTALQRAGDAVLQRVEKLPDSPQNRKVLSHIVGIERWGQNRLNVILGAPFVKDEYNGYRPAREATYAELTDSFRATRAETMALAQRIDQAGKATSTAPHNNLGDLTAKGWLRYLTIHATMESRWMR